MKKTNKLAWIYFAAISINSMALNLAAQTPNYYPGGSPAPATWNIVVEKIAPWSSSNPSSAYAYWYAGIAGVYDPNQGYYYSSVRTGTFRFKIYRNGVEQDYGQFNYNYSFWEGDPNTFYAQLDKSGNEVAMVGSFSPATSEYYAFSVTITPAANYAYKNELTGAYGMIGFQFSSSANDWPNWLQTPDGNFYAIVPSLTSQPAISSQNATVTLGQSFTPVYSGGAGTGAWQFMVQGQTGWQSTAWIPPAAGTYTFQIKKLGDSSYIEATSATTYTLTVNKASQPPVTSQNATITVGQGFTPAYSGGAGTGAWQFMVQGQTGWQSTAWTQPATGTYTFQIKKLGDSSYNEATSATYTLTVNLPPNDPPTVTITASTTQIRHGESVHLYSNATDPDANMDLHSFYQRGPRTVDNFVGDSNGWVRDADNTTGWENFSNQIGVPTNAANSSKTATYTPHSAGYWQFMANARDARNAWGNGPSTSAIFVAPLPALDIKAFVANGQASAVNGGHLDIYLDETVTVSSTAIAAGWLSEHNIYGYTPGPVLFSVQGGAATLPGAAATNASTRTVTWTPGSSGTHTIYAEAFSGKSPGERINGVSGWPGYADGPFGGLANMRITVGVRNNPTGSVQVYNSNGSPVPFMDGSFAIACWSTFYVVVTGHDLDGDADRYYSRIALPDGTLKHHVDEPRDAGDGYNGSRTFGPFTANVAGDWQLWGHVTDATARPWNSVTPWNENANGWYSSPHYTLRVILSPSVPDCLGVTFLSSNRATIVWNASSSNDFVSGYEIFRNGVSVGTTKDTSFELDGLAPSTTYSITVRAKDAGGNYSPLSQPFEFKTSTNPTVQVKLNSWGSASFPWQPSGGSTSYYEIILNPQRPSCQYYANIEYTPYGYGSYSSWINPSLGYCDSGGTWHNIISFSCWTYSGATGSVYMGISSVMVGNVPCVSISVSYIGCYNDSKSIYLGTDPPYSDPNLTLTYKSETQGAHYYTFVLPLEAFQSLMLQGDYGSVWAYEQWNERKPQNPPIFSSNQTIYLGEDFMPAFVGGSGTGAFHYSVSKQKLFYPAYTLTTPWKANDPGIHYFNIGKIGDDTYADATAGPYTLDVRHNPTGSVQVLDASFAPLALSNNAYLVTVGDTFYLRVNGSDLDGDAARYYSQVTLPSGILAHNENAERNTGDGHNGSRTFGPYTANVAGNWKVKGRVSDATARAWGSITPWNENGNGWYSSLSYTLRASNPSDDAAFVSQNVPKTMAAGASGTVTVTMRNTGTQAWNNNVSYPYGLGSQSPQDNTTWGTNRVSVGGTPVQPGQTKTFSFIVTAPQSGGHHDFQWRMVRDGVEWFGASTPKTSIRVVANMTDLGSDGIPVGLSETDSNGIPYMVLIGLGLDPAADNSSDPRLQNIMKQYQYNTVDELTESPERKYQLDAEGNITGSGN